MENGELEKLAEELTFKRRNVWNEVSGEEKEEIMSLCEEYKRFLDGSKTEREAAALLFRLAREKGFVDFDVLKKRGFKPGDRFVKMCRGKAAVMGIVGDRGIEDGFNLIGSHIDAPRIDLKPNPLYEKRGLALFKTRYYGGIKKYQWTAVKLALHGVVILKDGRKVEIAVGEDDNDPVFTITDLLPHLAQEQGERKLSEGIKGEELNVLAGSIPLPGDYKEKVKLSVLKHLNERYGMVEEDFITAEIEIVPAGRARDVGFDRGLVGAYGQDDRVCAFASWKALEGVEAPEKTAIAVFADKEETGSAGNTGMQSRILEELVADILSADGKPESLIPSVFCRSEAISADVNPAIDPTWEDVMDELNSAQIGCGVCVTKYTGSRGKAGANDAHAEFVAKVVEVFRRNGVIYQTGELGKVDAGGGGTIAQFLANFNMNVVDCGVPVLSMHSPFEVTSKADIFMACRAYRAFLMSS